jgi:predicted AAA+ superfamily ATPase
LGIREPEQLAFHAQRGSLFENLVVGEFLKGRFNRGRQSDMYFWRDSKGLEVDLLLEDGLDIMPVEIKSGQTIAPDFLSGLKKWCELSGVSERPAMLVYGGAAAHTTNNVAIVPWRQLPDRV